MLWCSWVKLLCENWKVLVLFASLASPEACRDWGIIQHCGSLCCRAEVAAHLIPNLLFRNSICTPVEMQRQFWNFVRNKAGNLKYNSLFQS